MRADARRLQAGQIWGGDRPIIADIRTAAIDLSIALTVSDGDRGGDNVFVTTCSEDRTTRLILADVTGHGSNAGHTGAAILRTLERCGMSCDACTVMREVNQGLIDAEAAPNATTTALALTVDASSKLARFCVAGHHPGFIQDSEASAWVPLAPPRDGAALSNLPLGVVRETSYSESAFETRRGMRFCFYSDGVTEAPNPAGTHFDADGLFETLNSARTDATIDELVRAVQAALDAHTNNRFMHDDVTIVVLEVR